MEDALLKLNKQGGNNPLTEPHLIVLGMCGVTMARDCCPCMLHQSKPIWVLNRGRVLNMRERMQLMGFNPDRVQALVSSDLHGNSMAINVVERLLCRILPAVRLTGRLPDRWEDGSAQKQLTSASVR